ncbi:MAG: glycosyltransferase [Chloroflexota bacterium]|nr:glycosyltransferase [Chloroflexota bacterium]
MSGLAAGAPATSAMASEGAAPADGPVAAVVIPTYRRPDALARTLDALMRQEAPGIVEVVICDDGSPAPERAQVEAVVAGAAARAGAHLQESSGAGSAAGADTPNDNAAAATAAPEDSAAAGQPGFTVRLIRQDNAGPAAARNAGARATRAPLLIFLDDDCAPAPGWLATHLAAHAGREDIAVQGHVAWAPDVRVTPFMELVVRGAQFNFGAIADPERVPFTSFYTANCSLRRADLAAAGWFDASLPPYMEDTEFAYRLSRTGACLVYRPGALVHHEHAVELAPYLTRQRRAGRAAVQVVQRHPELFDVVGVADVADISLREQFYSALLRYAFVVGVEEGLGELERDGHITGAELRGRFERWTAGWAVRQASHIRAWRERAASLEKEVQRRDARIAEVVQAKDAEIARLEGQLARINRLPPLRAYHALRHRLARARMRHNTGAEAKR